MYDGRAVLVMEPSQRLVRPHLIAMRSFLAIILILATTGALWAANLKLVMKDGSEQSVRSYERQGNRVRFYSLDRNAWEEVPADLVDWKATEEVNQREKEQNIEKAREIIREQAAEIKAGQGPEVAPGLNLPEDWGAYALVSGKVVSLPVSKAGAHVDKRRTAVNILLPAPVLKNRKLVTLPGAKSATQFAKAPEGLYVTGRASETSRFGLLRLTVKGDTRKLEAIMTPAFGTRMTTESNQVELILEDLPNETTRLIPRQPLLPGEYAVVEFLDEKLNLYVWDFGIGGNEKP
jgi:hypothetical protein